MRFPVVLAVVLQALAFWSAMSQNTLDDLTTHITCNIKKLDGFCGGINYTEFATPNFRNGTEEDEIEAELETYIILYTRGCSNALVHFLCAYYQPSCFHANSPIRLAPCRELCWYVQSSCEPAIKEFNADETWPKHLDCNQFPLKGDENGDACFPDFYTLEEYQTLLELPAIPGAVIPSDIELGYTVAAPTEPTTPTQVPTHCPTVLPSGNTSEAQPPPETTSTSDDEVAPSISCDEVAPSNNVAHSTTSNMIAPATSSDTASPSTSSTADGGTSTIASRSPTPTVTAGEGSNSASSNVAGSVATILLAEVALVMVAMSV